MQVKCQCGAGLRRPLPPKCPNCGALVIRSGRSPFQWLLSLGVAVALMAALIALVVLLVQYLVSRNPPPKPPQERPFERNL